MKNEGKFHHLSKTLKTLVLENPKTDTKHDFSTLPHDILNKIGSHFKLRDVQRACLVCKSWRNGLWPLWEEKTLLRIRGGKCRWFPNDFTDVLYKKASLYMHALVDAGLVFWEIHKNNKDGDHTVVPAEPPNMKEAVKWLYQASEAGYVRQQYQLALCLQRAIGTNQNLKEAASWYLRAAESGNFHAMYEVAICYSSGRGITQDRKESKKWLKLAADHGHRKAQFGHGCNLLSEGLRLMGAMYLDMAERGGVKAATDVKTAMVLTLPPSSRESARILARSWHPTRPSRRLMHPFSAFWF
ncbi:F-box family protein [Artemisia annua]|uniref:F-box family protein n=1 Tax=Artemisia annua TaxID=35608 RepID=A0A2U1NCR4_ARTAN|nr:F-box family protein [Artemisia annua]